MKDKLGNIILPGNRVEIDHQVYEVLGTTTNELLVTNNNGSLQTAISVKDISSVSIVYCSCGDCWECSIPR